jgi:peptidyl-prolyl cis-trans isomerase D
MLQFFRNFFKSKFGVVFTLAFLVLIAIAFGLTSIDITGASGGVSNGEDVAVVGDQKIAAADLSAAVTTAFENQRQQDPTLTMPQFIAGGGMTQVVDQVIQRTAISEFARKHGLRAGKRLVDSELVNIPAFQGASGKFDQNQFRAALNQRGLSEELVRNDIAAGLFLRQTITAAGYGTVAPQSVAMEYAKLLKEHRKGLVMLLPSAAYAPKGNPSDAQLGAFYSSHRAAYTRPERRVIRYAEFGEEALGNVQPPTEAQIAANYNQNKAQYAARSTRTFTQLVVPTEAAAKAIVDEVKGGKSLAAAATTKGLATTTVGPITQADFAGQSSQAVANAAFAAAQGAVVPPARGGLGWYVLRVDKIENIPARTLAEVHDQIAKTLSEEQKKRAFVDLAESIEEQLDDGASLAQVSQKLNAQIQTTEPLTVDGRLYGKEGTAPPVLATALKTAFEMEQGRPQIAPIDQGAQYIVFEASDITPSAPAPLGEIKDQVIADWRKTEGATAAKAAADRILQRIRGGQAASAAIAAEKIALPPPEPIDMSREQLAQQQRVPPVLALMFSMARGTAKRLEMPQSNGWFVVKLDDISVPTLAPNDPAIAGTQQELGSLYGDEYAQELIKAAEREVGVKKNQAAIDAVAKQLTGGQSQ